EQLGLAQQLVLAFELALFFLAGALVCQARFDFAAGSLRCAVGAKVCLRLVEALGDSGVPLGLVGPVGEVSDVAAVTVARDVVGVGVVLGDEARGRDVGLGLEAAGLVELFLEDGGEGLGRVL